MAAVAPAEPSTPSKTSMATLGYPPSPTPSSLSSKSSLNQDDEENVTVTANRLSRKLESKKSQEDDLRLLAISTHMTEVSYTISDIQTRIFEIQELRHKSQSAGGDSAGTTSVIDQSLMNLDERLESVSQGMKSVNDSLEPYLQSATTPTSAENGESAEVAMLLRKHATLTSEWSAVQEESEVLREELKEDKWLTVFRTVTDQADGMMSSLEKAVNRCQDFIWQVHRRGEDIHTTIRPDKNPISLEVFNSLLESFEAKKKHYMPATSKVLSIIDKGVKDRVTKNGETLRRHAESAARWKNLKERISRTDADMQTVKRILLGADATPSEAGSSTSGVSHANGYLATPPNARSPSVASSISRSISPFRKFARKITGSTRQAPVTPLSISKGRNAPSSEPTMNGTKHRNRASLMNAFRPNRPQTPVTPDKPTHKYSHSVTPESSTRSGGLDATVKLRTPPKPTWNSSTKVEQVTPSKRSASRPPSSTGRYADIGSGNPSISTPYKRSLSRTSMASSRPWSPITSVSTTNSSTNQTQPSVFRPPSRARTPSRTTPARSQTPSRPVPSRSHTPSRGAPPTPSRAPSRANAPVVANPRARPETPSQIPGPAKKLPSIVGPMSDDGFNDDEGLQTARPFSPAFSVSAASAATSPGAYPPRPPSRSMIPVPSLSLSTPSRPGTSLSSYSRSESPTMAFRSMANRAQTPESALKSRVQRLPIHQGTMRASMGGPRPSLRNGPPSAFRTDGSISRPGSRSASRTGAFTPSMDQLPMHEYIPGNDRDPLDVEVASIVNSIAHGLLVERVDPPLRKVPKEGEEVKAQYAFSNALGKKIVTCRLTTLVRSNKAAAGGSTTTKKVMCRVGGGWQDLSHYMLNRQAGM